ncbi:MAG: NAD-dependent succinate-semialdehyde dehydrogenase [Bdellovibrionales bacterium]|nr:NAD-dependent succinate-semialdehyde dehydrogenase [Bdellovibrionales bacterium]
MNSIHQSPLVHTQNFIGGQWQSSKSDQKIEVRNPADQSLLAEIECISSKDYESIIVYAQAAFDQWKISSAPDRSKLLTALHQKILQHQNELAHIITLEQGKSIAQSLGEIRYAADFCLWYAEEAKRIYGDVIDGPSYQEKFLVLRAPVGICAAITPWNFPLAMITRKLAPAIAAGCSMIIKPSEETPLTALALGEILSQIAMPKGLVQIINGNPQDIGEFFCSHPAISKLTFTGSTEVGKLLMKQCASSVKNISLELGGNAPFIVFEDADLDRAVEGAMSSKFRNTGQTCICSNRFLIHKNILDAFVEKMKRKMKDLRVGKGIEGDHDICPLINASAMNKIQNLVREAVDQGAQVLMGAEPSSQSQTYVPTMLKNIQPNMNIFKQEIFGPVVAITSFETEAQAIALANQTHYGLAAYFYTENFSRSFRVAQALEYGMIGVNKVAVSYTAAPFGGVKQSGLGREGSKFGLDEYVEKKSVALAI